MHEDATKQLRLDRRLAGRRGWIAQNELAGELDRLPDVGDKAELIEAPASRSPDEPSPQGS